MAVIAAVIANAANSDDESLPLPRGHVHVVLNGAAAAATNFPTCTWNIVEIDVDQLAPYLVFIHPDLAVGAKQCGQLQLPTHLGLKVIVIGDPS